jgi:putative membrane protein
MISNADHERIAAAVSAAEARTSGEILCVLSHKVSDYREIPLAWGAAAAMIIPALAAAFGLHPWLVSQTGGDWVATNAVYLDVSVRDALMGYAVLQLAVFALVAVPIAAISKLKLFLTPGPLKQRRVRRAALHHLAATKLLGVGGAVVIFASEAEHMVAVVADEALHLKAGDAAWEAAVAAVLAGIRSGDPTSGFVAAIEVCGGFLADHFPPNGSRRNALSDGLLEI